MFNCHSRTVSGLVICVRRPSGTVQTYLELSKRRPLTTVSVPARSAEQPQGALDWSELHNNPFNSPNITVHHKLSAKVKVSRAEGRCTYSSTCLCTKSLTLFTYLPTYSTPIHSVIYLPRGSRLSIESDCKQRFVYFYWWWFCQNSRRQSSERERKGQSLYAQSIEHADQYDSITSTCAL